jgi:hypothetical protein
MTPAFNYSGPEFSDGPFTPVRFYTNCDGVLEAYVFRTERGRAMTQDANCRVNTLVGTNMKPSWMVRG